MAPAVDRYQRGVRASRPSQNATVSDRRFFRLGWQPWALALAQRVGRQVELEPEKPTLGWNMSKATRSTWHAKATAGRLRVVVDRDVEPVDWDRAVARFLLAVKGRSAPASVVAGAEQPSAAACLCEPRPNAVSGGCIVQAT